MFWQKFITWTPQKWTWKAFTKTFWRLPHHSTVRQSRGSIEKHTFPLQQLPRSYLPASILYWWKTSSARLSAGLPRASHRTRAPPRTPRSESWAFSPTDEPVWSPRPRSFQAYYESIGNRRVFVCVSTSFGKNGKVNDIVRASAVYRVRELVGWLWNNPPVLTRPSRWTPSCWRARHPSSTRQTATGAGQGSPLGRPPCGFRPACQRASWSSAGHICGKVETGKKRSSRLWRCAL